ncbi:hypothetical protein [Arthrobacter sp. GMC3]|uniref:hypothetical protein n=1 Tax=Arthrobacter sp. GMC3 TaxID=2058894 RepID=UPI0011B0451C|nr:hypothetical protein [Arthrobacter sp. GMC3]
MAGLVLGYESISSTDVSIHVTKMGASSMVIREYSGHPGSGVLDDVSEPRGSGFFGENLGHVLPSGSRTAKPFKDSTTRSHELPLLWVQGCPRHIQGVIAEPSTAILKRTPDNELVAAASN